MKRGGRAVRTFRAWHRTITMIRRYAAVLMTVTMAVTIPAALPASAETVGSESFQGVIIASGTSGDRVVTTSVIVAKGVFNGTGRVVEIASLPNDSSDVQRDDLVFDEGTMHLVSTVTGFTGSGNPRSCIVSGVLDQTGVI